jgi:hypothetical protein
MAHFLRSLDGGRRGRGLQHALPKVLPKVNEGSCPRQFPQPCAGAARLTAERVLPPLVIVADPDYTREPPRVRPKAAPPYQG